jgi:hypothetical protein
LSGEQPEAEKTMSPLTGARLFPGEEARLDQPTTPPRLHGWIVIGAGALAALLLLVLGGPRLANIFALPDCDDAETRKAVERFLQDKKIKPAPLSDVKAVSSTRAERICVARMEYPGGAINLQYRIDWKGWASQTAVTDMVAEARIDPAQLNGAKKAAGEFLALAKDAPATGRPPRLAEPAIRALLDKVFDLARIEGATLAAADIPKAGDWFEAGDRVGAVYILAGTGVSDIGQLQNTANVQQRTQRNVAEFSAEFARYLDFQVKLAGIMAAAELKRGASSDAAEMKWGTETVRSTLAQSLIGSLTTLAYDGPGDEWRRQRLAVMTKVAADAARMLTADQARAVRQHALTVVPFVRDKSIQDGIRAMADAVAPP